MVSAVAKITGRAMPFTLLTGEQTNKKGCVSAKGGKKTKGLHLPAFQLRHWAGENNKRGFVVEICQLWKSYRF